VEVEGSEAAEEEEEVGMKTSIDLIDFFFLFFFFLLACLPSFTTIMGT